MNKKVFWMQPETTELGKNQALIEKVAGSKSFCVLPWIHLATRPNGDMRICCVANASGAYNGDYTVGLVKNLNGTAANFGQDLPSEAFNNDYMKSVRKIMLAGDEPASCKKCFDEESSGVVSKRIWETISWYHDNVDIPKLIKNTKPDGSIPFKLKYLDLRLGHTCNLKCIMCSPHDSSQWVADHKKVFPIFQSPLIKKQMTWDRKDFNNFWHENTDFWSEVYDQIPNITQLYFAGGEPLMIREHKMFLEEIINRGFSKNISLRYNSNGILVDDEIINIWSKFKKVKFGLSIDGMGDRLHYIRYPTDWEVVKTNLWKLDSAPDNISVSIAFAIQLLNIKHVPDFIKWKISSGFKKVNRDITPTGHMLGGGVISAHLVWIPTWLSIRVLPKEDKAEVRKLFEELKQWLYDNYTTDVVFWEEDSYGWKRWEAMLDWMDSEDNSHLLPDLKEYIRVMDSHRGTNAIDIFPELKHLL